MIHLRATNAPSTNRQSEFVPPTGYLVAAVTLFLLVMACPIVDTAAQAGSELGEAVRNMAYPSEWTRSGKAPLVGGVYEEPAAQGSASKILIRLTGSVAVGTIGDQETVVVVLVTDPGGSGVFYDLYVLRPREDRWDVVDRAHLGDRIRVNTIGVERGLIRLDLTVHGPRDGTCCPTERSPVYYALQRERLVKVSESEQKTLSRIEGHSWAWEHTVRVDGTRTGPTDPGHYTLRLGPEGQLNVRADCNQAGGRYRWEGSQLTLVVTHSTMATCPPESLDRQFLEDLAAVAGWRLDGNSLHLELTSGGTLVLTTMAHD